MPGRSDCVFPFFMDAHVDTQMMNGDDRSSPGASVRPLVVAAMASQALLVVLGPSIVAIADDLGTSTAIVGQARSITALVAAAAFRGAHGPLMVPLHEGGWSIVTMSAALSVNLVLYGLTAPFAAALMERFGLRRVVSAGLLLIAAGAGLSVLAQAAWQLVLTWGLLIGLGTGSMALVFAATVANAWFVKRRGLVMGILTAGGAAGQLVFLPVVAYLVEATSWKIASLLIAAAAVSGALADPSAVGSAPLVAGAELADVAADVEPPSSSPHAARRPTSVRPAPPAAARRRSSARDRP